MVYAYSLIIESYHKYASSVLPFLLWILYTHTTSRTFTLTSSRETNSLQGTQLLNSQQNLIQHNSSYTLYVATLPHYIHASNGMSLNSSWWLPMPSPNRFYLAWLGGGERPHIYIGLHGYMSTFYIFLQLEFSPSLTYHTNILL